MLLLLMMMMMMMMMMTMANSRLLAAEDVESLKTMQFLHEAIGDINKRR